MSGEVYPRRARAAVFAALFAAAFCVGMSLNTNSASSAPPPKYRVDICKDFDWLKLVKDVVYHPVFSVSGECNTDTAPYDVPFSALGESYGTEEGAWEYPFHTGPHHDGLVLTKLTTLMYGSDGSADGASQGLRVCGVSCGDLITLSQPSLSSDDPDHPSYSSGSSQVPTDAYWLRFVGRCVTDPCGPSAPIRFMKIELEYSEVVEDSAPTTQVSKRDTVPYTFSKTVDFGWVNSPFTFHWNAADVGAGLTKVSWSASRGGSGTLYDNCKNSIENAYLCPLNQSGPLTIDPTSKIVWQEGPQAVVVDAIDRVGLRASSRIQPDKRPASVTFKIDRTDPTPTSLTVDGVSTTRWLPSNETTLSWINAGESVENVTTTAPASGVVAAQYDFDPEASDQPNPGPQIVEGENIQSAAVKIPGPGLWSVSVRTIDRLGHMSLPMTSIVGLDPEPPGAPEIDPIGWIGSPYLIAGKKIRWSMPPGSKPSSGICGFGRTVDDLPTTEAPTTIDIDEDVTSATLPDGITEGEWYLHLRAISCSGVAGETAHQRFDVDLTSPRVSANHTDGRWVNGSNPLRLTALDGRSGIDSIHVSVDGAPATRYPGADVEPVLAEGRRSVSFQSRDAAGNTSLEESVEVGVDRSTPDGWIEEVDPTRPTLIGATVSDAHSGIDSAVVQYRLVGANREWTPLPTRVDNAGDGVARLMARFPDASTADGAYDIRTAVVDLVGNRSLITSRFDGTPAKVVTPVRGKSSIGFAFDFRRPARCGGRSVGNCTPRLSGSEKTVEFGRGATVVGRLKDPSGKPMGGVKVNLLTRRIDESKPRDLAVVTTERDGTFHGRIPPGVNREVTARYPGGELIKPSTRRIKMFTRSKIGIRVKRKRIRSGQRLLIRGSLATGGEKIGILGLHMRVHVLGTSLFYTTTVLGDGTFQATTDPLSFSEPKRMRLRAIVPQQAGWPYAAGRSRVVTVNVVP